MASRAFGRQADHPCIEDLKRKDFCVAIDLKDPEVLSPFMSFLAEAVGERF